MREDIAAKVHNAEQAFAELSSKYPLIRGNDGQVDLNALYVFAKAAWTMAQQSWALFAAIIAELWKWMTGKDDPSLTDADIAALLTAP